MYIMLEYNNYFFLKIAFNAFNLKPNEIINYSLVTNFGNLKYSM